MEWVDTHGYWPGAIVCLAARDEAHLYDFLLRFDNFKPTPFYEPDIGNELSAFGVILSQEDARCLKKLPLSGSCRLRKEVIKNG